MYRKKITSSRAEKEISDRLRSYTDVVVAIARKMAEQQTLIAELPEQEFNENDLLNDNITWVDVFHAIDQVLQIIDERNTVAHRGHALFLLPKV